MIEEKIQEEVKDDNSPKEESQVQLSSHMGSKTLEKSKLESGTIRPVIEKLSPRLPSLRYSKARSAIDHQDIQYRSRSILANLIISNQKRKARSREWTRSVDLNLRSSYKNNQTKFYLGARDAYLREKHSKQHSMSVYLTQKRKAKLYSETVRSTQLKKPEKKLLPLKPFGRFGNQMSFLDKSLNGGLEFHKKLISEGNKYLSQGRMSLSTINKSRRMSRRKRAKSLDKVKDQIFKKKVEEYNQRKKDLRTKFNYLGTLVKREPSKQKKSPKLKRMGIKSTVNDNEEFQRGLLSKIRALDQRLERKELRLKQGVTAPKNKRRILKEDIRELDGAYMKSVNEKILFLRNYS